jgi:YegS/Rv2252/BmrU family lipid kinase
MRNEWFFIINATAGNGKSGKKISCLINMLNKQKILFELELTKHQLHALELAKKAANEGYEKIISVGGDGTLHEVVNGIMLAEKADSVKLGILPEGGGNDYAKNFHLPGDVAKGIEIFLKDKIQKVDVGKVGDSYFINSLGLGFDAKVAYFAQRIKGLNGLPRYLVAVAKAMVQLEYYPVKIFIDDEVIEQNILFISINNGKYSGGGFQLTPDAIPDDGKFDICIAKAISRKDIVFNILATIRGKHTQLSFVNMRKTDKITVVSSPVSYYFDGEIPVPDVIEKLDVIMLPRKISLLVP